MNEFETLMASVNHEWTHGNAISLYGLVRSLKPGVVVEIGSFLGYSAAWMAQALKENGAGHLHCFDNFSSLAGRHTLESNLAAVGVREWITIHEGDSDMVQELKGVDFAYVDGWHSYAKARSDFDNCDKLGAECICIDDTVSTVGPRRLMDELRFDPRWEIVTLRRDTGMTVCMRATPLGPTNFSQE